MVWAYAKTRTKPGERVMALLEGWAQAVAGEFQSQDIANKLWAYAKMGTDIANTLWAYDKMRRRPGETSEPSGMIQW